MTTITIPRETFDQMLEALEAANIDNDEAYEDWKARRDAALSAVKAVSEQPKGLFVDLIASHGPDFVAEMAAIDAEPQAQGDAFEHGTSWDTVCRRCDDESILAHPQASEPAGWKLVPVEPTPEMCDAGANYMNSPTGLIAKNAHYFYKAMLAAAPEATK